MVFLASVHQIRSSLSVYTAAASCCSLLTVVLPFNYYNTLEHTTSQSFLTNSNTATP